MRKDYTPVSAYTLITPNYAPTYAAIPTTDPVEANLEVTKFAEANAVIDYIRKL